MKIADQMNVMLADADPVWATASADLAHAIIERTTSMSADWLRAFVASTSTGARFATASDNDIQSAAAVVARTLL